MIPQFFRQENRSPARRRHDENSAAEVAIAVIRADSPGVAAPQLLPVEADRRVACAIDHAFLISIKSTGASRVRGSGLLLRRHHPNDQLRVEPRLEPLHPPMKMRAGDAPS